MCVAILLLLYHCKWISLKKQSRENIFIYNVQCISTTSSKASIIQWILNHPPKISITHNWFCQQPHNININYFFSLSKSSIQSMFISTTRASNVHNWYCPHPYNIYITQFILSRPHNYLYNQHWLNWKIPYTLIDFVTAPLQYRYLQFILARPPNHL